MALASRFERPCPVGRFRSANLLVLRTRPGLAARAGTHIRTRPELRANSSRSEPRGFRPCGLVVPRCVLWWGRPLVVPPGRMALALGGSGLFPRRLIRVFSSSVRSPLFLGQLVAQIRRG